MENTVFIPKFGENMEDGFAMDEAPETLQTLEAIQAMGVGFNQRALDESFAEDSAPTVTSAGVNNSWFYLNYMAKKPIQVVTQKTVMDDILGRTNEGSWAHNTITKQVRELTGRTSQYKDFADATAPRVNRAYTRITRDVVRLSAGLIVSELENRQAALQPGQYSPHQDKREAIALIMKLDREAIMHYGYQLQDLHCYGLFNDPLLPAFEQVAEGQLGTGTDKTKWENKTAHEIIRDLMTAAASVQKRCKANFVPSTTPFKLVIPVGVDQYLGKITECGGFSVRQWIEREWKKCEIVVDPTFDNALGNENVFYIIVGKLGTNPCAEQEIQSALFMVGKAQRETGFSELWSMATAGCFVSQPLGIGRYYGI